MALILTVAERQELERRVRSRKIRAEDARRAQVILMLAAGEPFSTITATVGCYPDYVSRWKRRFEIDRVAGLRAKYRGQPATVRTPAMEARILSKTRQRPPDGSTHWSTRKLGKVLGISHVLVLRVWRRAGLQPHRVERYMASDDPDFERKAADVIGLYLKPPQHAVVFAQAGPSATGLSTTGTAPSPCTRRSTPGPEKSSARPCLGTRVPPSWSS
jgi:transposase